MLQFFLNCLQVFSCSGHQKIENFSNISYDKKILGLLFLCHDEKLKLYAVVTVVLLGLCWSDCCLPLLVFCVCEAQTVISIVIHLVFPLQVVVKMQSRQDGSRDQNIIFENH